MASAADIARYLIHLASCEPDGEEMTHLRLQKLLYYVQGWSLAYRGNPMFTSAVEAWDHGPVVRRVYPLFRAYGKDLIPKKEGCVPDGLSAADKRFVDAIWANYRQYSASKLRDMTHAEDPWREAFRPDPKRATHPNEISQDAMLKFFRRQARQHAAEIGELAGELRAAERAISEGQGVSLDALRRRLGHEV